jgi:RimJ/RimL family protein N-acetyltransferase
VNANYSGQVPPSTHFGGYGVTSGLNCFEALVFGDTVGNKRMPFTKIVTERLALRQLVSSDAQKIFAYRSRPEVARYQSWGIESRAEIQSQIESLAMAEPGIPGTWYQIGIVLQSSSELIGDCGFCVQETEPRQAEFGISLAPKYQCHGYATEALRALLNYLLVDLGKHRAFGSVDPRNLRSIKLMQRVGMRNEAHFVRSLWFRGEWVDDVIFAILASDWTAMNGE